MSKQTVVIEVTQRHINLGKQMESNLCPVARAIRAAIPGARKIAIGTQNASFTFVGKAYSVTLPKRAKNFISDFDINGKDSVKPLTFRLTF